MPPESPVPPSPAPSPDAHSAADTRWVKYVLIGCGAVALLGIVIIVIGIVAAVAIPNFIMAREKAFDEAAKNELRNVMTAEEVYYSENLTYAWELAELDFPDDEDVTTRILVAHDLGYSICSQHAESRSSWWVDEDGMIERRWSSC